MESALPVFVGRRTAAEYLGCWMGRVEKMIGSPDVILRFGARDDQGWLQARLNHFLNFAEAPAATLYSKKEAYRRAGITVRVADRLLNSPVAFLASGYGNKNLPLFCERQINEIRAGISSGTIRVQARSLKMAKRGVCLADPRHTLASDLGIETIRVRSKRKDAEFWAKLL
jgi:hypothetical protein